MLPQQGSTAAFIVAGAGSVSHFRRYEVAVRYRCPTGDAAIPAGMMAPMSEHFDVHGGARLAGEVEVVGAKNSVLKLMAAALLAEGTTTVTNCPQILDVPLMADVLRSVGCEVEVEGDTGRSTTAA